jgi:hypothetical protein
MRCSIVTAMLLGTFVLLSLSARADAPPRPGQKPSTAIGAFCQTADQLKGFIHIASEKSIRAAITATSAPDRTCAVAPLAFYEHGPATSLIQAGKTYRLFPATVVGVMVDRHWLATSPSEAFMAIMEKGEVA